MKQAALLLLFLTLAGCALLRPPPDPAAAQAHRNRAENLIFTKDYPAAAQELALAIHANPDDGDLYLRHGEVLEALGKNREARATFEKGRKIVAPGDALREELTYRLALLLVAKLDETVTAQKLMDELPEGAVARRDVEATLALNEGRGREALRLLNEALEQKPTRERAARILYHAAQAYRLLGDNDNATGALYQAINLTSALALTADIEALWHTLKDSDPTGH